MMDDDALVLGVDIGTSRVKAMVLDTAGEEVHASAVATPWSSGSEGRIEMAPVALCEAVAAALHDLGELTGQVVAVGVAGMAESGVALDGDGRPLTSVIAWHDPRGEEAVARLQRELGDELDHRIGQRARTVLSAAKLGWLVEHGSCGGMATWLGVPELVLHALTGSAATEHSLAARTGCYDVGRLRWLPEVAELLGFSIDLFPDVRSAGDVMGRVSRAGTTWSGLPEGVAVTIAGHDHLVGSLGAGSTVRDFVNSVGTAETVVGRRSSVPDVPHAVGHGLAVTVFPGPAGWAVLASGARAGIVVSGAADALGGELAGLDHLAEAASRSVDAKEFVAALARGDEARVPDGAPGEVWRGVLEALVARTADAVERVMTSVASPDRLVVFGMGSRSRPWLRAKADALTVPVWRSTVSEAVARGAGLVAGVAAGWWPGPEGAPAPRLEQP